MTPYAMKILKDFAETNRGRLELERRAKFWNVNLVPGIIALPPIPRKGSSEGKKTRDEKEEAKKQAEKLLAIEAIKEICKKEDKWTTSHSIFTKWKKNRGTQGQALVAALRELVFTGELNVQRRKSLPTLYWRGTLEV